MLHALAIDGYRSLRSLRVSLEQLNVITGANGTGKSNVYRALHLLSEAAHGNLGRALALEGGLPSAFWAGPERTRDFAATRRSRAAEGTVSTAAKRVSLGFTASDFSYQVRLGLIPQSPGDPSAFVRDPDVKDEWIWVGMPRRPAGTFLERRGPSATVRDHQHKQVVYPFSLDGTESVLSQVSEPHRYPEISAVREGIRGFRFYHQFRTDPESPLRLSQIGTRTPVLSHDGRDVAAALQTIVEVGDVRALEVAIADAFDGARLALVKDEGRFELGLAMPGMLRPMRAAELSDGTLRFLCLLAALLSPRPPELLVLNEPETSLHPRLLEPLARLVVGAARTSQLIVVSHAEKLVETVAREGDAKTIELAKHDGETIVVGQRVLDEPGWPD